MGTIEIIGLSFMAFSTVNVLQRILSMMFEEKKRVSEGYPPFDDFDYYYVGGSYLIGLLTLIIYTVVFGRLFDYFEPTTAVTIIFILFAVGVYVFGAVIGTTIMSFVQSRVRKNK